MAEAAADPDKARLVREEGRGSVTKKTPWGCSCCKLGRLVRNDLMLKDSG
jgi:hypothetical protein